MTAVVFTILPVYTYFGGALLCFLVVMVATRRWMGRSARHATVTALAVTFSNTVLLGIPLVKLAFGDSGLVSGRWASMCSGSPAWRWR